MNIFLKMSFLSLSSFSFLFTMDKDPLVDYMEIRVGQPRETCLSVRPITSDSLRGRRGVRSSREISEFEARHAPMDIASGESRFINDIVQKFCFDERVQPYLSSISIDFSSYESSLRTLRGLQKIIKHNHRFRKKCIRPLENLYGKGYVDDLIDFNIQGVERSMQLDLQRSVSEIDRLYLENSGLRGDLTQTMDLLSQERDRLNIEEERRIAAEKSEALYKYGARVSEKSRSTGSSILEREVRRERVRTEKIARTTGEVIVTAVDTYRRMKRPATDCFREINRGNPEIQRSFKRREAQVLSRLETPSDYVAKPFVPHHEFGGRNLTQESVARAVDVAQSRAKNLGKVIVKNKSCFPGMESEMHQYAVNHRSFINQSLDVARECGNVGELPTASSMTHFAEHMVDVGEKTACVLAWVGRGGFRSMQKISRMLGMVVHETFTDPLGLLESAANSFKQASVSLASALRTAVTEPGRAFDAARIMVENFGREFMELPLDEQVTQVSEFVFDMLIGGKIAQYGLGAFAKGSGFLREGVRRSVASGQRVLAGLTEKIPGVLADSPMLGKLVTPVYSAAKEALKVNRYIATKGGALVERLDYALDKLRRKPKYFIIDNGSLKSNVSLIAKNERWNLKGLLHTCKGEVRRKVRLGRGLKSGMHTERAFEHFRRMCNFDVEQLLHYEVLENGVTRMQLPVEAFAKPRHFSNAIASIGGGESIQGAKTLWPRGYTPKMILQSGVDIISDAGNFIGESWGSFKFIGYDRNGIRGVVHVNKITEKITTAFPSWVQ